MNFVIHTTALLDKKAFLSYRLWQFSLRNIFRLFPWYYLFRILLCYPVRAFRGWAFYHRLVVRAHPSQLSGTAVLDDMAHIGQSAKRFLIAPGYCMKPYDYARERSMCPAGHFNHECRLLEDVNLLYDATRRPKVCSDCGIAPLVAWAAHIRADVYIMTSALDIAKDVYLPAIKKRGARCGIFFLCPYSLEPFTFGLATAAIKGALMPFCRGDCKTHEEWTNADIGIKNDQTFIAEDRWQAVLAQLQQLKALRGSKERAAYAFDGHVYRVYYRSSTFMSSEKQ